ncbi:MAG TPA: hypothetical protein VEW05_08810 [Candidatus Polarisedimenticolia bacterium]|nr:hypothetical protein [Candidatus Polarisedimenticolia bacterium]
MQNAHERFGTLEFIKRAKDTTTRVRVYVDRVVLEPAKDERGQVAAHLVSMIGGDAEIGALWAAVTDGALFHIQLPGGAPIATSLGLEAQCFRGSVAIPGRKRPARHLVAVSAELAKTKPGADREGIRTVLCDDDPVFVLYRVASRYGLPVVPEWAPWFMCELSQRKAIRLLTGVGCSPVLVGGTKATFLKWIGKALREGLIRIPKENGSITWKLPRNLLERSPLEAVAGGPLNHPVQEQAREDVGRVVNQLGAPTQIMQFTRLRRREKQ